jgi:hypothetical protein
MPLCVAYGLAEYNVSLGFPLDDMWQGVDAAYFAHNSRRVTVLYRCNASVPDNTLQFDQRMGIEGTHVNIIAYTNASCPKGYGPTPTPEPRVIPNKPTAPSPLPSVIPSPHPVRVIDNGTHFVAIDLRLVQGAYPLEFNHPIRIQGNYGEIFTIWSSWDTTDPPSGWTTHGGGDRGNLWECWFDENEEHYCQAVANKHVSPGWSLGASQKPNLDRVRITYPGNWSTAMVIASTCNPYGDDRDLDLGSSHITYSQGGLNQVATWTFNTSAKYTCPNAVASPYTPAPTVRPSPPANATQQPQIIQGWYNLDLRVLSDSNASIFMGYGSKYYATWIYYSPWDRTECPIPGTCGTYATDSANIWKCVNNRTVCIPIGDINYGQSLSVIGGRPENGFQAEYQAGLANLRTRVRIFCGTTTEVDFYADQLGSETPATMSGLYDLFEVSTSYACRGDPTPSRSPLPPPSSPLPPQSPRASRSPRATQAATPTASRGLTGEAFGAGTLDPGGIAGVMFAVFAVAGAAVVLSICFLTKGDRPRPAAVADETSWVEGPLAGASTYT